MAPEVTHARECKYESDVFSLGNILYYMANYRQTHEAITIDEEIPYNSLYSQEVRELNQTMLRKNLQDRPSID